MLKDWKIKLSGVRVLIDSSSYEHFICGDCALELDLNQIGNLELGAWSLEGVWEELNGLDKDM